MSRRLLTRADSPSPTTIWGNPITRYQSRPPSIVRGLSAAPHSWAAPFDQLGKKAREKQADREFFLDLLSSAVTKRDAKAYLSRITASTSIVKGQTPVAVASFRPQQSGISLEPNLGHLFGSAAAVKQSPRFSQYGRTEEISCEDGDQQVHHLALVKLIGPEKLDESTMQGLGLTLSQLSRLGMTPCVVLQSMSSEGEPGLPRCSEGTTFQAQRLERAIHEDAGMGSRILDNVFSQARVGSTPRIFSRNLVMAPLRSGKIPIILPQSYSNETQSILTISANQAMLALTTELAGLNFGSSTEKSLTDKTEHPKALQRQVSLDRLIIFNPEGGIPLSAGAAETHVFLNLEEEYDSVCQQLCKDAHTIKPASSARSATTGEDISLTSRDQQHQEVSVPVWAEDVHGAVVQDEDSSLQDEYDSARQATTRHLENMELLRDALGLLPPSSSAIIISPLSAAKSSKSDSQRPSISAVGTRAQKNPLIYNLLTDKPPHSASLPAARLGRSHGLSHRPSGPATPTFVKKGMPLTIVPSLGTASWTVGNKANKPRLKLTDPRIDLGRLIHLINDSFNRKLDTEHYLRRVNESIAGLIIAGEYEGGALFTWETPANASPDDESRQVPYLDKFAVLKRSQGAGGVADIVFNTMVRTCFPHGVCWRSRQDNPVNKWYFERARGTRKLPGTNWTMFWTTEDVEAGDGQRLRDYEAVCRGVEPSWADAMTPD